MMSSRDQSNYPKDSDENKDTNRGAGDFQIDTTEYTTRLELLYEVANKATSYPEILKLIEDILSVTQRILNSTAVSMMVVDNGKGILSYQLADEQFHSSLTPVRLSVNSGLVRWVARTGMTILIDDVSTDERYDAATDAIEGIDTKSILAVPLSRGQKVIGVLMVVNKEEGGKFTEQDSVVLSGLASTEALVLLVSLTILALRNIDLNRERPPSDRRTDRYTERIGGHARRVKEYALIAARTFNFTSDELQTIEFGALLHDIGKIGIRDLGLRASEELTDYEKMILLEHSVIGADIVSEIPFLEKAAKIVRYHHERYNGSGYPEGLRGDDIPMFTRLITVADAFDNMTTEYPHYDTLSDAEALRELRRKTGVQFCPVMTKAFIAEYTKWKEEQKTEEEITVSEPVKEVDKDRAARIIEESEQVRNQGIELLRIGRYEAALEAFERAIDIYPNNAVAWRNKGTTLGRLGKDSSALRSITRSIELDPRDVNSWHNKATALYRMGRNKEGKQAKDIEKQIRKQLSQAEKLQYKTFAQETAEFLEKEKEAQKRAEQEAREQEKRAEAEAKER
ncbi:MAG: HD domain-containing protein, partial [Dehalococcoidia bacterium]